MKKKKFKYNKADNFLDRTMSLSEHYKLSSEVTEHILRLSKDSYIAGSNTSNELIQQLLQEKDSVVLKDDEVNELINHIEETGYLDSREIKKNNKYV